MNATRRVTVFFACVGNSGRSQIAEGFARAIGGDRVVVKSGGSVPAGRVSQKAVEVMREKGIDLSRHHSKAIDEDFVRAADVVVTMGCGDDACPAFIGKPLVDWALPDPKGRDVAFYRQVRDDIERRVRALLAERGVA